MIKLTKIEDVPAPNRNKIGEPGRDAKEFMQSSYDVAEIDIERYGGDLGKAWSAYHAAAKRNGCRVIMRQHRLFFVKEGVKC